MAEPTLKRLAQFDAATERRSTDEIAVGRGTETLRMQLAMLLADVGGEYSLVAGRATSGGADEGDATTVKSPNMAWVVGIKPSTDAPRFKLTLPENTALQSVYDPVDGDLTASFERVSTSQVWLSSIDFYQARLLWVTAQ